MDKTLCPICGAPAPVLAGAAQMIRMFDTDVPSLVSLFQGKFDAATCEAGCKLNVRPTVTVMFTDSDVVQLVLGSPFEGQRADRFAQLAEEEFRPAGIIPQVLPSLDDLRNAVAQRLIERARTVQPLFEAFAQDTLGPYVLTHWRSLTPQVFAALRIALAGVVPGIRIGVLRMSETEVTDQR